MYRVITASTVQETAAKTSVAGSWTVVSWSWIESTHDLLQLIALAVAIVASVVTARYYLKKTKELDE